MKAGGATVAPPLATPHFHSLGRAGIRATLPIHPTLTRVLTLGRIDWGDCSTPSPPPLPTDFDVLAALHAAVPDEGQRDLCGTSVPPPRCHHAVTLEGSQVSDAEGMAFHGNITHFHDFNRQTEPLRKHRLQRLHHGVLSVS